MPMLREENDNHAPESVTETTTAAYSPPQKNANPKELFRQEGGGQRGAKYRMFLADGFDPDTAWYFSGPEYIEKMKRHENEKRGIKYCKTCDQRMPEPGEEIKLDEENEKLVTDLMEEDAASRPRRNSFWIFHSYLMDGYTVEQAEYLSGPKWAAALRRYRAMQKLGIKRCAECEQFYFEKTEE